MTVVNKIYLTDELLQDLSSRNIPNVDLNHTPMFNRYSLEYNYMNGSFYENQNIVSVTNINNDVREFGSYQGYWETSLFTNCQNLTDAPNLANCTNLTNIPFAFKNCFNLVNAPEIPNSVTNMSRTFYQCQNLVNAPVIPNYVNNMEYTFSGCANLTDTPDLSNFIRLTSLYGTFQGCLNLVNVSNISNSITSLYSTFSSCFNLVNAPTIPNSVTNIMGTFEYCSSLLNVPVIPNSVTKMYRTFAYCYNLVNVPDLANCINLDNMYGTFQGCSNLVNAPLLPNSVTNMCSTFLECYNLVNVPVISNSAADISSTFSGCYNLVNVPVIPNSVTNMDGTFSYCSNLINVPVIPESVTDMNETFWSCSNLVNVPDLSNCINLINMSGTFQYCSNLTSFGIVPNNVENMGSLFSHCFNLSGDIIIESEKVYNAYGCFEGTSLEKNVLIPMTMSSNQYRTLKYYWITNENKIIYSLIDFYNKANGSNSWLNDNNIEDENFERLNNASLRWNPDSRKFFLEYYDESVGYWKNDDIFYHSENDVRIYKSVGDTSFTYDSFINAGYSTTNRVDGVLLKDINDRGTLEFVVTPSQQQGTSIYVDNNLISGSSIMVGIGSHTYKLINSNYPIYYGSATVTRGNTTTITKDLTNISGHKVTINTNVENCDVTINGETITTVTSTQYESDNIYSESSIEMNIQVSKYGYSTYYNTVIFNNENIVLNVTLISQDVDLSDWEYTLDGDVATLTRYVGNDVETLIIPNV